MAGFYIKRIIARSDLKEDAIVDFTSGLNIIQGRSDTGKSCVLKCMEFVFGGNYDKLKNPFKESSGYDSASVVIGTEQYGDVILSRKVGSGQVEVVADSEEIENGIYVIKKPGKNVKKPKPVLNLVMMKLLGIDGEPEVPGNMHFEKKRMTWENLLCLYYIKEERIDKPDPLFELVATYEKTLFLSSLLFLLTGRDFSEHDAQTKKEIKKARKEAVHDYVNQKIREANQRQKELAVQIENLDDANVEEQLREMVESLQKTESSISAAIETSQKLLADIMEQEAKVTECEVLLSRYGHLRSQYRADIQRLTFIVDGEQNMSTAPKVSTCPFCDGKITPRAKKSYIEASRGELSRIVSQMDGLVASEKDVQVEKAAVKEKLRELKEQRADIEKLIQQELKPQASEIEKTIEAYRGYIQLSNEVDLIVRYAKGLEQDLTRYDIAENEEEKAIEYHPKEYFDTEFQTTVSEDMDSILRECQYLNLTGARFNLSSFDIEVNGETKASHGKGYHSYFNTVVALAFRNYFHDHAKYNADFLIIDTPLHGFDENDTELPDSMKDGLFKYFVHHLTGQLIIVENTDHVPSNIDFEVLGANVITFTKKLNEGRYGFLHDVY